MTEIPLDTNVATCRVQISDVSPSVRSFLTKFDEFKVDKPVSKDMKILSTTRNIVKLSSYWFDASFASFIESTGGEYEVLGSCRGSVPLVEITIYFT